MKKIIFFGLLFFPLTFQSKYKPLVPPEWTLRSGEVFTDLKFQLGEIISKAQTIQADLQKAQAAAAIYPVSLIDINKALTNPLVDSTSCTTQNNNGGVVPAFLCLIGKIFPNAALGTISGVASDTGYYYKVTLSDGSSAGYGYKAEMWIDFTTKDGTTLVKFLNYWFDSGGQRGKMEGYSEPIATPPALPFTAWSATWDSTSSSAQTLNFFYEQGTSSSSKAWANRQQAFNLSTKVNSVTNVAEIAASSNSSASASFSYKVNIRRNQTYTLAYGQICNLTSGSSCLDISGPIYECARNDDVTQISITTSLSSMAADGSCGSLATSFTLTPITPNQSNLELMTSGNSNFTLYGQN